MKNTYLLYSMLASACLAASTGYTAEVEQFAQMRTITKGQLPSSMYKKIKINGLQKQSLEQRNVWKSVAPGFVNVPTNVVINGKTITMEIDIGGLMQSRDAGKSWRYISYMNEGGITARSFFDFDINPSNSKFMVIGGNRIYRSADDGKTWHSSYKGLPLLKYGTRGNGYGQVKYLCDGSTLYTALGTKVTMPVGWERIMAKKYSEKKLFFSHDNGASFKSLNLKRPFAVIKKIYPHPTNKNIVYASFADGDFYVIKNAASAQPSAIRQNCVPAGFFVSDMSVNPQNDKEMLLAISSKKRKKKSFVYKTADCFTSDLQIAKLDIKGSNGKEIKCGYLMTVGYNPGKPGQIVLGERGPNLYISDNNGASFRIFTLPGKFYCDGNLGHFYGSVERVYFGKSNLAVIISKIGAWITRDNFRTVENLTMKYSNNKFSNFGIGSPANINNISICRDNVFFSAQDHGAWISDGNDYMWWKRLTGIKEQGKFPQQKAPWGGTYTWLHHVQKIFASYDEQFIYINCNALIKHKFKHNFMANKKFFQSRDRGKSWNDVTSLLGKGAIYPEGSWFQKVLFDPENSSRHWLLMSDALYYTADGGKTFKLQSSPLFNKVNHSKGIVFSDLAYDRKHNILYLSLRLMPYLRKMKLGTKSGPAALYRSSDRGKTWKLYDVRQNGIYSIAVTRDGTLALGTQATGGQPARLIIIPFGKKFDESMVKLTVGDTPEEVSANQICIGPVIADGKDILAYSNSDWIHSDRFFSQGPLLSTDNGKTFKWIKYNLPATNIWSADMKDGKIMLGTTFGLMYWKYK